MATRQELTTLKGQSVVFSVTFSPDGKTLAAGSKDGTLRLWNLATRQELTTLKGHNNGVYSIAFSPDGKTLATAGEDDTVKLWRAATEEEVLAKSERSDK